MAEGSGDSHSSQPEGAEALSMNELVLRLCDGLESSSLDDEQELLDGLLDQLDASAGRIGLGLDAQAWDGLVKWTFERRFGWSENADGGCRQTVDSRAKKHINDCLDQLVEMLKQQPLAPALLHALGRTAGESGKPVVRQRCYLHVYAWVKQQGAQDPEFDEQLAGSMPDLTKKCWDPELDERLAGSMANLSKASAEKLREVVGLLAHAQLEGLVNAFFDTYATAEQLNKGPPQEQKDAWRTKEGILLGMNSILVFFGGNVELRAVSSGAGSGVGAGTGGAGRGGAEADSFRKSQKTLPVFISGRLKPLLFRALAHQQLSVRETAAKALPRAT
ncbi:hypothetical protein T484DRAFT_1835128 [Baffinella frigidus]|nr:hypothetical protein T484DRAFT_1835128 [Cryptophyta sp. CCMP2293]